MEDENMPSHIKLEQDKAKWDAEQERKRQELVTEKKVIIKGIDIPFRDLVSLLVKIAFAKMNLTQEALYLKSVLQNPSFQQIARAGQSLVVDALHWPVYC